MTTSFGEGHQSTVCPYLLGREAEGREESIVRIEVPYASEEVSHRDGSREAPPVTQFPAGRVLDVRTANTSSMHAMMVEYDRTYPTSGDWYSEDRHFFDMSLSKRPPGARGYFGEAFRSAKPLGKIFFAPAGHPYHGEGGRGRQKSLGLFIRAQRLSDGSCEFGERLIPVLHNCLQLESTVVRDLLVKIAREVTEPGLASAVLLEGLSLTLLVETARLLETLKSDGSWKGGLSPWRLKRIESRVRDGEAAPSLSELSELCQMSRRQLIRAYRATTGQTIGAFVQAVTTERAKALLSETDRSIGDIASTLGFASLAGFSSAFRRASGQSPRAFRITHQRGLGQAATKIASQAGS